jgi:hypothetical protein
MDEEKRLATDILLSIEAKLITLEKRQQNSENILKILLNKLNRIPSVLPPPSKLFDGVASSDSDTINKDNFDNRPKTNRFAEIAASQGITIDERQGALIAKPADNPGEMSESTLRLASRGQRGPKPKGQKSSVTQVLNRGNDPLFLANVEVLDNKNELVSQTRTNTKGRWLMTLTPGDYNIHVTKRFPPESGRKSVDTTYQITVPISETPLELDPILIDV